MTARSAAYLSALHQLLNQHFNLEELRTLCLDLNVDYESVSGAEKPSWIRELLLALGRHGRLAELLTLAQQQRPKVDWPPVPDDFQLPTSLAFGGTAVPVNQYHVYGDVVEGDKISGDKIAGDKITFEAGATAIYQGLSVEEVADLVVELKHKDQPTVWDGRIPYLGLTAFQESDAQFFYGRERVVDDLLVRVQHASFIVIAGPSGSGKSSVARAGLFHALRTGGIVTSDRWLLATMQPQGDPFGQLAIGMERATKSTAVGDVLHTDNNPTPELLLRQIHMHLSDDSRERCVLFADQFEELFTQTHDPAVQTAFINLLIEAAQTPDSRFVVVLALRSEFVSQCARFPTLRDLMSRQFQLVGAMEPHDLAKAVTLPGLEVGAEIDPALVSRIVTDMKGEPGALPLMSFALRDLFEAEKTKKGATMALTLSKYLARGGIESALERHANKVFDSFTDEQKALARSIFSRLIEVGQGRVDTQRTATLQELIPAGKSAEVMMSVIGALAQEGARLITTDRGNGDGRIEEGETNQVTVMLAHEKLIDAWPWLRRLVNENRETIALQNQINHDAQIWAQEQDAGFLYRGGRLLQVEEKLEVFQPNLDVLSQQFIEASLDQHQREIDEQEAQRQRELNQAQLLAEANAEKATKAEQLARSRQTTNRLLLVLVVTFAVALMVVLVPIVQREVARWQARGDLALIDESESYGLGTALPNKAYNEIATQELPVPAFKMEKFEVTNARYRYCVNYGDCALPNNIDHFQKEFFDEHPVTGITAVEAATFCTWIGRRLPNELEWERAARGPDSDRWPWPGNGLTSEQAVIGHDLGTTQPVGSRPLGQSEEKVHDLIGNVWEWTASYDGSHYDSENVWSGDWQTLKPSVPLIRRGLSFFNDIDTARVTWRFPLQPTEDDEDTGFRCAANATR